MEDQICIGDLGAHEALVDRAFWEALVEAEGVSHTWQPGEEPLESAFTVAEDPTAQIAYPWNPATPEAEAFFMNSAMPSIFDGISEAEVSQRSQNFFNHLNQLWPIVSVEATLIERFAARVPQNWLAAIAQRAEAVVNTAQQTVADVSNTLADQLVQCVREVAPGLAEDDFYVLARPLAGQMRNSSSMNVVDAQIAQVPQVAWEQLSDVQRARLGLAIARYAINELQPTEDA
jgi:hypothetical protein